MTPSRAIRFAVALGLASSAASAQSVVDTAQNAVVIVVAKGIDTANGNVEVATRGTGFFINSDGILVTANHLRSKLGDGVDQNSIVYEVYLGTGTLPIKAQFMSANAPADMLILYAPVTGSSIKILRPVFKPSPTLIPNKTALTALGYPNGFGYLSQPGVLTSWGGAINPVQVGWTTSVIFNEGMSGGPVITADGRVAAIVKGVDQGIGIVVPVNYVPSEYWEHADQPAPASPTVPASTGRIVVSRPVPDGSVRQSEQKISLVRSPCDSQETFRIPLTASAGWRILDGTVKFTLKQLRADSAETTIVPGPDWAVDISMLAAGTCGAGQTVIGDTAEIVGVATYKEASVGVTGGQEVIAEISSASTVPVPLATSAANLTYRFEAPDGSSQIITPKKGEFKVDKGIVSFNPSKSFSRIGTF